MMEPNNLPCQDFLLLSRNVSVEWVFRVIARIPSCSAQSYLTLSDGQRKTKESYRFILCALPSILFVHKTLIRVHP